MSNVETLIEQIKVGGAPITEQIESALRAVPRHMFVPDAYQKLAYIDEPLPIGQNQTISQPSTVVMMTDALDIQPGNAVLEIGTGSGWQAALIAYLVGSMGSVVSIERFEDLAIVARENIKKAGITNVDVRVGDGSAGMPGQSFDGIIVTAAAPDVPRPLVEQLKKDGKMVIPVGKIIQDMLVYKKTKHRLEEVDNLGQFRFVPLVGKHGFEE